MFVPRSNIRHSCGGAVRTDGGTLIGVSINGTSLSSVKGAAIYAANTALERCLVTNCTSTGSYVVYLAESTAKNCLFSGTGGSATRAAGYIYGGTIENCTFALTANGESALETSGVTAYNTIFAGASTLSGTFSHCLSPSLADGDNGNIAGSPVFRNPSRGDYRLKRNSPGIDAGVFRYWIPAATDLNGNPRQIGDAPDIGCYEWRRIGFAIIFR